MVRITERAWQSVAGGARAARSGSAVDRVVGLRVDGCGVKRGVTQAGRQERSGNTRTFLAVEGRPSHRFLRDDGVPGWAVDFEAGTVRIASAVIRVKGEGLLRKETKSAAGERTLPLPVSAVAVLRRRFMTGARLDQPLFPSLRGGFRGPANVRRDLREARGKEALAWITSHTFRKTAATILDDAALSGFAWWPTSWGTRGRR